MCFLGINCGICRNTRNRARFIRCILVFVLSVTSWSAFASDPDQEDCVVFANNLELYGACIKGLLANAANNDLIPQQDSDA